MRSRNWFTTPSVVLCLFVVTCPFGIAFGEDAEEGAAIQESHKPVSSLGESLQKEVLHAISIGAKWLEKNQHEQGYWSNPSFPAMTGLALSAILGTPEHAAASQRSQAVNKGLEFILSCVQDDGGIYRHIEGVKGGGKSNYNTALCIVALANAGDAAYWGTIEKGRKFLVQSQHLGKDPYYGGMGYDASTDRAYADMSNTFLALDALNQTEPLERGGTAYHINRKAALDFLSRCQHLKEFNNAPWLNESDAERGGFVYHPLESKAGEATREDGVTKYLLSYGSITYAGCLSYLNAGLEPKSPRVQAALEWCGRHWTLDENPRLGQQSLYYYYLAMAKALSVAGVETLETPKGPVKWRAALVKKLLSLQRITEKDGLGYWRNENNRWWENDPNLATSYALIALETALFHGVSTRIAED